MAVAFDAASSAKGTLVSSLSWSHTCAGSDRLLWVGAGNGAFSPSLTTSVTYNGVSMTEIDDTIQGFAHLSCHRLTAPATGAHTVAVTYAGVNDEAIAGAVSYTGVDQTTPVGTFAGAGSASTTPSVNVSSASGELVVDAVYASVAISGNTLTVGSGQTARVDDEDAGSGFGALGMSEEAGAATVTMSWTLGSNADWRIGGIPLKPAAEAALNYTTPAPPNQRRPFLRRVIAFHPFGESHGKLYDYPSNRSRNKPDHHSPWWCRSSPPHACSLHHWE